jgi:DNA-binding XRE family transcriptional regulator
MKYTVQEVTAMRYETIITYGNKEIRFKAPKKIFAGSFTLPDFLRRTREYNQDISNKHQYTQEELDSLRQMELGEIPIPSKFLEDFAYDHHLPKKIARLGTPSESIKARLANKLYQLRIKDGKTQATVAKIIGISTNTYTGYESGRSEPDLETLEKIANLFDVSLDALISRRHD